MLRIEVRGLLRSLEIMIPMKNTGKASAGGGGFLRGAGFFLTGAVLMAAGFWFGKKNVCTPVGRAAKTEWRPADFSGFPPGALMDQTTAYAWDEVPPFRMDAVWRGLAGTNAEAGDQDETEAAGAMGPPRFTQEETWREPSGLFFRPDIDPRVIRYKIDPSFGFEKRERLLKGMMVRVQVDF